MPSFNYPPSAGGGGGGGGGTLPVVGGSGAQYATVAAAQAIEVETVVAGIAAGAGTAPGIFRSAAIPVQAVNFYKDFWIVVVTAVPGNGLVCRRARVSAYDGIDQLTLDEPWDLTGQTIDIVSPIRLSLLGDIQENIVFTKNVEFDLAGHRVQGSVDQTGGDLCWIRGGGWITDGVQKTNIGVLQIDATDVSRRGSTIYAVLMTNGSNLGRTILKDSRFHGVVAGRRGRAGWEVDGCSNDGISEGTPANRNMPYRFFESVAGVAVVVDQADVQVDSEWSGAVFYSENSLTGATANLSINVNAMVPKLLTAVVTAEQPAFANLYCAVGGATLTMTWVANSTVALSFANVNASTFNGQAGLSLFIDFTGTFNVNGANINTYFTGKGANLSNIQVVGTATMTGTITLAAIGPIYSAPGFAFDRVLIKSTIGGTIADGASVTVSDVTFLTMMTMGGTTQNNAAASVTISGFLRALDIQLYSTFVTGTISTGTWTVSSNLSIDGCAIAGDIAFLGTLVSGGTFVVSGSIGLNSVGSQSAGGAAVFIFGIARHAGTGGTLTVSSASIRVSALQLGTMFLANASGAGATVAVTAAVVDIRGSKRLSISATALIAATAVGASASLTGALSFEECQFRTQVIIVNPSVVGATVTGPASVHFNYCLFELDLLVESVVGTLVWTVATLRFRNCHLNGTMTFSGNRFATVEAFDSYFNGSAGDSSVTATATRPALYRYWNCKFRAEHLSLEPDVVDDWISVDVGGPALVKGQLATIGAAGTAVSTVAASVVEGVVLDAAGGGTFVILVRRGVIPVLSQVGGATGVSPGDNCGLDTGTPIQQEDTAAVVGQRIGRALTAPSGGLAYTIVDLR